jgi:hypothetical protein
VNHNSGDSGISYDSLSWDSALICWLRSSPLYREFAPQLFDRHISTCLEGAQDRPGMRFDRLAAPIATQWPGPKVT